MLAAVNFWRRWPHSAGHQEKVDSFIQWENLRHQDCHQKPMIAKTHTATKSGLLNESNILETPLPAGPRDSVVINMIGFSERKVAPRSGFLQYTDGAAKNVTGITGAAVEHLPLSSGEVIPAGASRGSISSGILSGCDLHAYL